MTRSEFSRWLITFLLVTGCKKLAICWKKGEGKDGEGRGVCARVEIFIIIGFLLYARINCAIVPSLMQAMNSVKVLMQPCGVVFYCRNKNQNVYTISDTLVYLLPPSVSSFFIFAPILPPAHSPRALMTPGVSHLIGQKCFSKSLACISVICEVHYMRHKNEIIFLNISKVILIYW